MTRDQQHVELYINPSRSAAVGPMGLRLRTDGEMIWGGDPEVGFIHRGIEKIGERMSWAGFIPFTDRVDYLSSIHSNLAYALAVESLAGIAVPERAAQIRIIAGELNRIASHLLAAGRLAEVLGLRTGMLYALRDRERINNLFETLCGARLTYSYIRIGGVAADVTEGFIEKTYELLDYLIPKLREYHDLLSNSDIWIGRLSGVGLIDSQAAVSCGLGGPILRASGVSHDVRKAFPYSGYHNVDFEIPVGGNSTGIKGDAYGRHMVRMHEIEQSSAIIKQVMNQLSDGPCAAEVASGMKVPAGEAYVAVESPRGPFGAFVKSAGDKTPFRVRFRTPSFAVLNIFPTVLEGIPLSDLAPLVASLDIMISEVDR